MKAAHSFAVLLAAAFVVLLPAGCSSTRFEPPQVHGHVLMVEAGGEPVLWVLVEQEEIREVGSGGGRRSSNTRRLESFNHFEIRAYDPVTVKPVWRRRLVTIGDRKSMLDLPLTKKAATSVSGALLGQDGGRVWLVLDDRPFALSTADATLLADAAAIEQANPALRGLLPSEAGNYGFDRGLVLMAADARRHVVRGTPMKAEPYTPPAPPVDASAPDPFSDDIDEMKAAHRRVLVPSRPPGEVPARQITFGAERIGLYSEVEAKEAANDPFGDRHAYPYTIRNEGPLARRTFWRMRIAQVQRFDERLTRIEALEPVAGAPTFLRGRFLKKLPGDEPLPASAPDGAFVWHSTRADDAGRLALARIDTGLGTVWNSELPLSESSTANQVRYWLVGDRLFALGDLRVEQDNVVGSDLQLVSVALADGSVASHNVTREPTDWRDPERVPGSTADP